MDVAQTPDIELELCRIPGVRATRIVTNDSGDPIEVHVLSTPDKHPKQLVRDVQSVAIATFGIDIDRRIISVVQLDDGVIPSHNGEDKNGDGDAHTSEPRMVVDGVAISQKGVGCNVEVTLRRGEDNATGHAEGSGATSATLRLVATATLDALRQLEPAASRLDIETATVVRFPERAVAVTSVVLLTPPHEEVVSGSAIVRPPGDNDAMARAVLDATNRRLHQLR